LKREEKDVLLACMEMTIREQEVLAPWTTFKIGGPAKFFVEVSSAEGIREALVWAKERDERIIFIGGGSNILVSDAGFHGLAVHMRETKPEVSGASVRAFAGSTLASVVSAAAEASLAGMENLAGIPGSLGGAVRGNAGAFGTEMKNVVSSVDAVHRETGESKTFSPEECAFSYRMSVFKKTSDWIVAAATCELAPGNREELEKIMEDIVAKRNARQDQSARCAGSFFMNPAVKSESLRREFETHAGEPCRGGKGPAGWLIDRLDLRGFRIGGAIVSESHPNYILNAGNATADDVLMLMAYIKTKVRDTFGVQLREEVQLVGFDR